MTVGPGSRSTDAILRELVGKSSSAFILRLLGFAVGYVFVVMVTRAFGAEAMGIFALSYTVLQIAAVLGRLGLDSALIRFVSAHAANGRLDLARTAYYRAAAMALSASVALMGALLIGAPLLAERVFGKIHLSGYFRAAALAIVPLVLLYLNTESLRGLKRIKRYVFFQNVGVFMLASGILGLMLLWSRSHYLPVVAYLASLLAVAVFSLLVWLHASRPPEISQIGAAMGCGELLSAALPMLLSSSLMLIMQWVDTFMMGVFRTEAEVGVYNVAVKVATVTSVTLFAVNSIAAPRFAAFYAKGDLEGLEGYVRKATRLIFWTSCPVLLIFLFLPGPVMTLFGDGFRAGATALVLLTVGQFVNAASGSVGYLLQMTGRQRAFQNVILTATGINIILNVILIPRFGMTGAAVATMVSMCIWNLVSVVIIKVRYNITTMYVPIVGGR